MQKSSSSSALLAEQMRGSLERAERDVIPIKTVSKELRSGFKALGDKLNQVEEEQALWPTEAPPRPTEAALRKAAEAQKSQTFHGTGSQLRLSKPLKGVSKLVEGRSDFFAELAHSVGYEVQRLLRYTLLGFTNPLSAEMEKKAEQQVTQGLTEVLEHMALYVDKALTEVQTKPSLRDVIRELRGVEDDDKSYETQEVRGLKEQLDHALHDGHTLNEQLLTQQEKAMQANQRLLNMRSQYYIELENQRDRFRTLLLRHLSVIPQHELKDVTDALASVRLFNPDEFHDEDTQLAVSRKAAALEADHKVEREALMQDISLLKNEESIAKARLGVEQKKARYLMRKLEEIKEASRTGANVTEACEMVLENAEQHDSSKGIRDDARPSLLRFASTDALQGQQESEQSWERTPQTPTSPTSREQSNKVRDLLGQLGIANQRTSEAVAGITSVYNMMLKQVEWIKKLEQNKENKQLMVMFSSDMHKIQEVKEEVDKHLETLSEEGRNAMSQRHRADSAENQVAMWQRKYEGIESETQRLSEENKRLKQSSAQLRDDLQQKTAELQSAEQRIQGLQKVEKNFRSVGKIGRKTIGLSREGDARVGDEEVNGDDDDPQALAAVLKDRYAALLENMSEGDQVNISLEELQIMKTNMLELSDQVKTQEQELEGTRAAMEEMEQEVNTVRSRVFEEKNRREEAERKTKEAEAALHDRKKQLAVVERGAAEARRKVAQLQMKSLFKDHAHEHHHEEAAAPAANANATGDGETNAGKATKEGGAETKQQQGPKANGPMVREPAGEGEGALDENQEQDVQDPLIAELPDASEHTAKLNEDSHQYHHHQESKFHEDDPYGVGSDDGLGNEDLFDAASSGDFEKVTAEKVETFEVGVQAGGQAGRKHVGPHDFDLVLVPQQKDHHQHKHKTGEKKDEKKDDFKMSDEGQAGNSSDNAGAMRLSFGGSMDVQDEDPEASEQQEPIRSGQKESQHEGGHGKRFRRGYTVNQGNKCSHCKTYILPDAVFCRICGSPVKAEFTLSVDEAMTNILKISDEAVAKTTMHAEMVAETKSKAQELLVQMSSKAKDSEERADLDMKVMEEMGKLARYNLEADHLAAGDDQAEDELQDRTRMGMAAMHLLMKKYTDGEADPKRMESFRTQILPHIKAVRRLVDLSKPVLAQEEKFMRKTLEVEYHEKVRRGTASERQRLRRMLPRASSFDSLQGPFRKPLANCLEAELAIVDERIKEVRSEALAKLDSARLMTYLREIEPLNNVPKGEKLDGGEGDARSMDLKDLICSKEITHYMEVVGSLSKRFLGHKTEYRRLADRLKSALFESDRLRSEVGLWREAFLKKNKESAVLWRCQAKWLNRCQAEMSRRQIMVNVPQALMTDSWDHETLEKAFSEELRIAGKRPQLLAPRTMRNENAVIPLVNNEFGRLNSHYRLKSFAVAESLLPFHNFAHTLQDFLGIDAMSSASLLIDQEDVRKLPDFRELYLSNGEDSNSKWADAVGVATMLAQRLRAVFRTTNDQKAAKEKIDQSQSIITRVGNRELVTLDNVRQIIKEDDEVLSGVQVGGSQLLSKRLKDALDACDAFDIIDKVKALEEQVEAEDEDSEEEGIVRRARRGEAQVGNGMNFEVVPISVPDRAKEPPAEVMMNGISLNMRQVLTSSAARQLGMRPQAEEAEEAAKQRMLAGMFVRASGHMSAIASAKASMFGKASTRNLEKFLDPDEPNGEQDDLDVPLGRERRAGRKSEYSSAKEAFFDVARSIGKGEPEEAEIEEETALTTEEDDSIVVGGIEQPPVVKICRPVLSDDDMEAELEDLQAAGELPLGDGDRMWEVPMVKHMACFYPWKSLAPMDLPQVPAEILGESGQPDHASSKIREIDPNKMTEQEVEEMRGLMRKLSKAFEEGDHDKVANLLPLMGELMDNFNQRRERIRKGLAKLKVATLLSRGAKLFDWMEEEVEDEEDESDDYSSEETDEDSSGRSGDENHAAAGDEHHAAAGDENHAAAGDENHARKPSHHAQRKRHRRHHRHHHDDHHHQHHRHHHHRHRKNDRGRRGGEEEEQSNSEEEEAQVVLSDDIEADSAEKVAEMSRKLGGATKVMTQSGIEMSMDELSQLDEKSLQELGPIKVMQVTKKKEKHKRKKRRKRRGAGSSASDDDDAEHMLSPEGSYIGSSASGGDDSPIGVDMRTISEKMSGRMLRQSQSGHIGGPRKKGKPKKVFMETVETQTDKPPPRGVEIGMNTDLTMQQKVATTQTEAQAVERLAHTRRLKPRQNNFANRLKDAVYGEEEQSDLSDLISGDEEGLYQEAMDELDRQAAGAEQDPELRNVLEDAKYRLRKAAAEQEATEAEASKPTDSEDTSPKSGVRHAAAVAGWKSALKKSSTRKKGFQQLLKRTLTDLPQGARKTLISTVQSDGDEDEEEKSKAGMTIDPETGEGQASEGTDFPAGGQAYTGSGGSPRTLMPQNLHIPKKRDIRPASSHGNDDDMVEVVDTIQQSELLWEELPREILNWLKLNLMQRQQAELYCTSWDTSEISHWPEMALGTRERLVREFELFLHEVLQCVKPTKHGVRLGLRHKYRTFRSESPPAERQIRSASPGGRTTSGAIQGYEYPFLVGDNWDEFDERLRRATGHDWLEKSQLQGSQQIKTLDDALMIKFPPEGIFDSEATYQDPYCLRVAQRHGFEPPPGAPILGVSGRRWGRSGREWQKEPLPEPPPAEPLSAPEQGAETLARVLEWALRRSKRRWKRIATDQLRMNAQTFIGSEIPQMGRSATLSDRKLLGVGAAAFKTAGAGFFPSSPTEKSPEKRRPAARGRFASEFAGPTAPAHELAFAATAGPWVPAPPGHPSPRQAVPPARSRVDDLFKKAEQLKQQASKTAPAEQYVGCVAWKYNAPQGSMDQAAAATAPARPSPPPFESKSGLAATAYVGSERDKAERAASWTNYLRSQNPDMPLAETAPNKATMDFMKEGQKGCDDELGGTASSPKTLRASSKSPEVGSQARTTWSCPRGSGGGVSRFPPIGAAAPQANSARLGMTAGNGFRPAKRRE